MAGAALLPAYPEGIVVNGEQKGSFSIRWGAPIAIGTLAGIALHLLARIYGADAFMRAPLVVVVVMGGFPLVIDLVIKALRREVGADFLAAISIITAVLLDEWLAAALVVLMLSGGAALERYALRKASSVLEALSRRVPQTAHRRSSSSSGLRTVEEIPSQEVQIGDELEIHPHEICPVDGIVREGSSTMDESFLTGEPHQIDKTAGCEVISGAVNGEGVLVIEALRRAVDSRYARIVEVMSRTRQMRPRMRRLGDQLGAWYTPISVTVAVLAWILSGDPERFLAVLVVATPCPLLIAIPVAIISAISLAAHRGIIIKDPAVLERVSKCRTMVFDKTGTLTLGTPVLTGVSRVEPFSENEILALAGTVERYSKHPLAAPILAAVHARQITLGQAEKLEEKPGQGLTAMVGGRSIRLTSRSVIERESNARIPARHEGLEAVLLVGDRVAGVLHFRDEARGDSVPFVGHLRGRHGIDRVLLLSGDRDEEVQHLARQVGISEFIARATPEQKVEIVRSENARAPTIFIGDGINDAPALAVANVGIAFGNRSDITGEAAGAVVLDPSLRTADELLHIGSRLRRIALQSAIGGMVLSVLGMIAAAGGYLSPVMGALVQEAIDLVAVINALRVNRVGAVLVDIPAQSQTVKSGTVTPSAR